MFNQRRIDQQLPFRLHWIFMRAALSLILFLGQPSVGTTQELGQRHAWMQPSDATLNEWLQSIQFELHRNGSPVAALQTGVPASGDRLVDFCRQLSLMQGNFRAVFEQCQQPLTFPLAEFPVLTDTSVPESARLNLRLLYGRWLAASMLFDESLQVLQDISPDTVVDPATLFFYRGVALHHLGRQDEALANLSLLRSNPDSVPQRFSTVAELMEEDLKATSRHQLDPVARLMDRIQIRLGHARAGTRVRKDETDVIKHLDELIDQIEKQLQASQSAAQSGGGSSSSPSNPAQDSFRAGPQGDGDVTPRELAAGGDWGNLPHKERERALQQLSKDFPSHYRDIVERYFRKLAQERDVLP